MGTRQFDRTGGRRLASQQAEEFIEHRGVQLGTKSMSLRRPCTVVYTSSEHLNNEYADVLFSVSRKDASRASGEGQGGRRRRACIVLRFARVVARLHGSFDQGLGAAGVAIARRERSARMRLRDKDRVASWSLILPG